MALEAPLPGALVAAGRERCSGLGGWVANLRYRGLLRGALAAAEPAMDLPLSPATRATNKSITLTARQAVSVQVAVRAALAAPPERRLVVQALTALGAVAGTAIKWLLASKARVAQVVPAQSLMHRMARALAAAALAGMPWGMAERAAQAGITAAAAAAADIALV